MNRDFQLVTWMRAALLDGSVKRIRERAGASQGEMAAAVRVSRAAVASWEQGRRIPRGATAVRYAKLLRELADGQERKGA
jgi:DNA-binding transcriptional regulator YiaG